MLEVQSEAMHGADGADDDAASVQLPLGKNLTISTDAVLSCGLWYRSADSVWIYCVDGVDNAYTQFTD